MHDFLLLSPHLLLTLGSLVLFCLGAFGRVRRGLYPATLLFTLAAGIMTLVAYPAAPADGAALAAFLDTGRLSAYFLPLLCGLGFTALLFLGPYAQRRGLDRDEELHALFLLALLGALLLAGGRSWLAFFLGLELLSLPLYVLIASRRDDGAGAEAAVKYFVLGAAASATLLFGIALVYAGSGTLDIAESMSRPDGAGTVLLGFGMILAGIGFKLSLAPFHLWAPDVYQGAPAPVAAFLASGVKAAVAAGLLRVVLFMGPQFWPAALPVLWACAAVTMLAANLAALQQTSLKRMLGYSSAAHMGYLLMGALSAAQAGPGPVMYYAAALALMDLGAFGALGLLTGDRMNADGETVGPDADDLVSLHGLGAARPWSAALLAVSLAALAGLPPTAGFTGKLLLLRAALLGGHGWLAGIGILASAISVFYYLRALSALYLKDGVQPYLPSRPAISGGVGIFLVILALLVLGLAPAPVMDAAAHLLQP